MKKIWIVGVVLTTLSLCGLTHATTVNVLSNANLDGNYAYRYAVNLGAGQQITSATIDWSNVTLTQSSNPQGTGVLYTDLLKTKSSSTTASDGDATGDYWATRYSGAKITSLGSKSFASVGTTLSWSYVLDGTQLAALNSYLAKNNGVFNIGIDPDCNYITTKDTVGGLSFTYTVGQVPDGATTALLILMGVAGVELFRRKFAVASC